MADNPLPPGVKTAEDVDRLPLPEFMKTAMKNYIASQASAFSTGMNTPPTPKASWALPYDLSFSDPLRRGPATGGMDKAASNTAAATTGTTPVPMAERIASASMGPAPASTHEDPYAGAGKGEYNFGWSFHSDLENAAAPKVGMATMGAGPAKATASAAAKPPVVDDFDAMVAAGKMSPDAAEAAKLERHRRYDAEAVRERERIAHEKSVAANEAAYNQKSARLSAEKKASVLAHIAKTYHGTDEDVIPHMPPMSPLEEQVFKEKYPTEYGMLFDHVKKTGVKPASAEAEIGLPGAVEEKPKSVARPTTFEEVDAGVKAGLIEPEQAYALKQKIEKERTGDYETLNGYENKRIDKLKEDMTYGEDTAFKARKLGSTKVGPQADGPEVKPLLPVEDALGGDRHSGEDRWGLEKYDAGAASRSKELDRKTSGKSTGRYRAI